MTDTQHQYLAAASVILALLVLCSLARELARDFYRPWLVRRQARRRAERRADDDWIRHLQRMNELERMTAVLKRLAHAGQSAGLATQQLTKAMKHLSEGMYSVEDWGHHDDH